MNDASDKAPPLASLVQAGEGQTAAEPVADGVWMVKDISNAYLVTTTDGDVAINTGFYLAGDRTKRLFAPHRTGLLRYIALTQAHPDHYGGVPTLREPGTRIVAQARFEDTERFFEDLHPWLTARSGKLWAFNRKGEPPRPPHIVPDITVDRTLTLEVGERTFVLFSTPGGETLCGMTAWLPREKIVFTGNLFGPVFRAIPNLTTVRGDRPRLVSNYLASLDLVRGLGAELLVTGHGEPIRGAARIRADLDRMHAAVTWLRDAVIAGMNGGRNVHDLMRETVLPDDLTLGEQHGKVSWAVRAIWEEHGGWFHYDSTTSLYGVPRTSIDGDLVELAGGAERLAGRAQRRLDAGEPLEALHLTDIALGGDPACAAAVQVRQGALRLLLERSGSENLSETMWLRNEITLAGQQLAAPAAGQLA